MHIPGVAVGVGVDGPEIFACHEVTIDQETLFLVASIAKTFTATTLMRLVAEGKVELNASVHRCVPELQLKDQQAAITALRLLNHTTGFDWRINADTGEEDDALERSVQQLVEMVPLEPPGTRVPYS